MKQLSYTRLLRYSLLPSFVLLAMLAITGFAAAQTPTPANNPQPGKGHHQLIPELQGIPPDQLFDHFQGSQFTITDAQGNVVVYQMTPGTVSAVTAAALTITPNGQSTAMSFNITPTTVVHAMPVSGSVQALAQGDKVVVLSKRGAGEAVVIAKHTTGMHRSGPMKSRRR